METKLLRIAELAKSDPKMKFTFLAHLLTEQSLIQCHHELPNKKATGVNGTTNEQYSENLKHFIRDYLEHKESANYQEWVTALSIAAYCEDGENLLHEWSKAMRVTMNKARIASMMKFSQR
jgi:hypothetical protein